MIDKAVNHLESLKSDEDFRVERDVKAADAALAKREQDKLDRRRAEMEACDRSRQVRGSPMPNANCQLPNCPTLLQTKCRKPNASTHQMPNAKCQMPNAK